MSDQAIVSRGIHPACLYSKADVCELMRLDEEGGLAASEWRGESYVLGGSVIHMILSGKSTPQELPPQNSGPLESQPWFHKEFWTRKEAATYLDMCVRSVDRFIDRKADQLPSRQ